MTSKPSGPINQHKMMAMGGKPLKSGGAVKSMPPKKSGRGN